MENETCANKIWRKIEIFKGSDLYKKSEFEQIGYNYCKGSNKECEYYFPISLEKAKELRKKHLLSEEETELIDQNDLEEYLNSGE